MRQFKLIITTMLLLAGFTNYSHAKSDWIDITAERLVNPSFDGNSNAGWTYFSNAGSQAVRCESMEFWNGTFDIYQTLSSLPAGHYRMSVQSYYRCQDNNNGYPKYTAGTEDITAYMYAGNTKQKLKSIYSFYFTEVPIMAHGVHGLTDKWYFSLTPWKLPQRLLAMELIKTLWNSTIMAVT